MEKIEFSEELEKMNLAFVRDYFCSGLLKTRGDGIFVKSIILSSDNIYYQARKKDGVFILTNLIDIRIDQAKVKILSNGDIIIVSLLGKNIKTCEFFHPRLCKLKNGKLRVLNYKINSININFIDKKNSKLKL